MHPRSRDWFSVQTSRTQLNHQTWKDRLSMILQLVKTVVSRKAARIFLAVSQDKVKFDVTVACLRKTSSFVWYRRCSALRRSLSQKALSSATKSFRLSQSCSKAQDNLMGTSTTTLFTICTQSVRLDLDVHPNLQLSVLSLRHDRILLHFSLEAQVRVHVVHICAKSN